MFKQKSITKTKTNKLTEIKNYPSHRASRTHLAQLVEHITLDLRVMRFKPHAGH